MIEAPTPLDASLDPEYLAPSAEGLRQATTSLYEIANSVDDEVIANDHDIATVQKGAYWRRVAEKANSVVKETLSSPNKISQGAALELTAATPYFIVASQRLLSQEDPSQARLSNEQRKLDRYYLSYFNGLLRNFAWAHPSVTSIELNQHLCNILEISEITPHPDRLRGVIADVIRGAQHETAAADVLSRLGQLHPSTTEQDLMGIDYILQAEGMIYGIPIDIKSSPNKILRYSQGTNRQHVVLDGKLMLHSGFTDDDLKGRFFAGESAIRRVVAETVPVIQKVRHDPRLRSVVV